MKQIFTKNNHMSLWGLIWWVEATFKLGLSTHNMKMVLNLEICTYVMVLMGQTLTSFYYLKYMEAFE
jgi:hypothetical protein